MSVVLPARACLLLDLDGTLIDIAPTPDSVVVPVDLPGVLIALRDRMAGALAIISGRPISQIDGLLPDVATAVAGEHGYAVRHLRGGAIDCADVVTVPEAFLAEAAAVVARYPGAILERKARGFVLHFRLAPEAGPVFAAALSAMLENWPHHRVASAHMAWEVKPVGIDKGRAVREIMARAPFAGRVPVFIGDDATDEDGMAVARAMGGLGLRVQEHFLDAAGVRRWLAGLARSAV
ncbi:MAG: trehalose-phosphatase [Acetobacteraceae bacterium]|nr:trehalose-phosphatase [Acetobacteraceae bacterium]